MATQRLLLAVLLILALLAPGAFASLAEQGALPADKASSSPTSSTAVFDAGHPGNNGAEEFPWQPSQPISTFGPSCSMQHTGDLAVDAAGAQYAVWYKDPGGVYFAYKPDGGPWSANEQVPGHAGARSTGVDAAGRVYIAGAWQGDVYFTWRSPGGVWSADERVNDVAGTAGDYVSMAVDPAGNLSVVWIDGRNGRQDVFFDQRQVDGVWSGDEQVNDAATAPARDDSQVAVDGNGNVYVVWDESPRSIMFAFRAANGLWSPDLRIASWDPGNGSGFVGGVTIAVDPAGNATVLYVDVTEAGNRAVVSKYRSAGGQWSWAGEVSSHCSYAPAVAMDSAGSAYALATYESCNYPEFGEYPRLYQRAPGGQWTRTTQPSMSTEYLIAARPAGNIYIVTSLSSDLYSMQRDAAGTWSQRARISDEVCSHISTGPAIAADAAGTSYAVWNDGTRADHDIYFAQRPAGGSWSGAIRINDSITGADQRRPQIAASPAGHLVVVWEDTRSGGSEIYFSQRPPGGNWSANERASPPAAEGNWGEPDVAVDPSGRACAVWNSYDGGTVYYFASCLPAGGAWEPAQEIGDGWSSDGVAPSIAMDSRGGAYAAWVGGSADRLNFVYRPWAGAWGPVERVDDGSASSGGICCPDLAVNSAGNAYAVWLDNSAHPFDAPHDLYFAYRPAGGAWGANTLVAAYQSPAKIAADILGNAYLIWDGADSGILAAYRPAGGQWGAIMRADDNPVAARPFWPAIAVDAAGNAYAAWLDRWDSDMQLRFTYAWHDDLAGTAIPMRHYLPLILHQ